MTTDLLNTIMPSIQHLTMAGYWIAFFAALLETTIGIGLLLPGSTIILLLGAMAGRGYLDVGDLIWFAVLGAIIGDNVNYFLGRRYGSRWLDKGVWFLRAAHIKQARAFMNRHGAKSVFLGRFIPSVKEIVPFIAGSLKMDRKTFLFWNVLGAIGWGLEWTLAGYIFAQSLNIAELWLSRAGLLLGLLVLFGAGLSLFKWLLVRKGRDFLEVLASLWQSLSEAVRANEHVSRWTREHPRTIAFVSARLDTRVFSGLSLTLLILAFVYVLALFAGIIEDVVTADPIVSADVRVANLLAAFRTDGLNTVFTWLTLLGKSQVVLCFLAAATLLIWIWLPKRYILSLYTVVIGSEAFTYLGKIALHRPRPEAALYLEHSYSFPSGHATIAVSLYGFLTYLLIRFTRSWPAKVNLFFIGVFVIVTIGLSRIYLGVHYLSDVWCGYLVGGMWLIIGIALAEWTGQQEHGQKIPGPAARPISFGLVGGAALFYLLFGLHYHPPLAPKSAEKSVAVAAATDIFTNPQMRYTESLLGERQEPINILFIAENMNDLNRVLERAGWVRTNQADFTSLLRTVRALILHKPYPAAPISPSFWNAAMQDVSFALVNGKNMYSQAHHVKIWQTNGLIDGRHLYVGMVNGNDGFKWLVLPKISPDLDTERELLYTELMKTGMVRNEQKIELTRPQTGTTFTGDIFFTDGKAYILGF